jgi:hypothetical protein
MESRIRSERDKTMAGVTGLNAHVSAQIFIYLLPT